MLCGAWVSVPKYVREFYAAKRKKNQEKRQRIVFPLALSTTPLGSVHEHIPTPRQWENTDKQNKKEVHTLCEIFIDFQIFFVYFITQ